jgi:hypothetical protein
MYEKLFSVGRLLPWGGTWKGGVPVVVEPEGENISVSIIDQIYLLTIKINKIDS